MSNAIEEEKFAYLKRKIEADRGFRCDFYRESCVRRRIGVRMRVRGTTTFDDYAALLDSDPDEYDRLIDTLTISVTRFFRDRSGWDLVERDVFPRLFSLGSGPVRIWSAGCATGEEPYSVSILLNEWASAEDRQTELERVHILGTDLNKKSLKLASKAIFPELSFKEMPDVQRERWFASDPPNRLREAARSLVSFEQGDLITDSPPSGQSFILCRNVMIYMDRTIREQLLHRFHEALVPGGFLMLGRVETLLGPSRRLFRPVSIRERVYKKSE